MTPKKPTSLLKGQTRPSPLKRGNSTDAAKPREMGRFPAPFPTKGQGRGLPLLIKVRVLVAQLCPTPCDPMDCCPPGSSDHGILQARILEWVAIPFSRGSSGPRDQTLVSCTAGRFFTVWDTGEPLLQKDENWALWLVKSKREKTLLL